MRARQLEVFTSADDPASDPVFATSLLAASRHQSAVRRRRRPATEEEVQALRDRLFPHRHCRGAHRLAASLSLCRHRSHVQVRLRAGGSQELAGHQLQPYSWRSSSAVPNKSTHYSPTTEFSSPFHTRDSHYVVTHRRCGAGLVHGNWRRLRYPTVWATNFIPNRNHGRISVGPKYQAYRNTGPLEAGTKATR